MELKAILESLIFASDKPLTLKQLKALTGSTRAEAIKAALLDIEAEFRTSGIQLAEVGGGFQFRTHPDCAAYVKKLLAGRPPRLTQAMLESLAIVAYRQPITRPEIEDIRGVDCGGVLRLLLERALIRIVGKKEEVGRPLLYGTTRQFLEFFNLKELNQLPTLREFTELSEDITAQLDPEQAALLEGEEPPPAAESAEPAPAQGALAEPIAEEPAPVEAIAAGEAAPSLSVTLQDLEAPPLHRDVDREIAAIGAPEAPATAEAELARPPAEAPDLAPVTPSGAAPAKPQTWARAAISSDEEDEDLALSALDQAVSRVDDILRAQRQEERARLRALVGETAAAAAEAGAAAASAGLAPVPETEAAPQAGPAEAREAADETEESSSPVE